MPRGVGVSVEMKCGLFPPEPPISAVLSPFDLVNAFWVCLLLRMSWVELLPHCYRSLRAVACY